MAEHFAEKCGVGEHFAEKCGVGEHFAEICAVLRNILLNRIRIKRQKLQKYNFFYQKSFFLSTTGTLQAFIFTFNNSKYGTGLI